MRPCGLLANYFTSCPTQLVVNICLKIKSFDYSSEISFSQWVHIALFVVYPVCHDDGIERERIYHFATLACVK